MREAGPSVSAVFFFFFNDTAPPEIYTLPLPDALPICLGVNGHRIRRVDAGNPAIAAGNAVPRDRKSGSAGMPRPISYAVFSLEKKPRLRPVHPLPPRQPLLPQQLLALLPLW